MSPAELRARARTFRNRWVNQELKQLEAVRRRLLRDEVDVLIVSDSSVSSYSVRDTDRTFLPTLISRQMGGARVATVAGPGYGAYLHDEILRVLTTLPNRPKALVISNAIRTNTMKHVTEHPIYNYPGTRAALATTKDARHRIRAFGRGNDPTPERYAAFEELKVTTRWGGTKTIGEFRAHVKGVGPQPWPLELERVLFDYFHGELFDETHPGLQDLERLGRRIKEYGVPAALYWCAPPMERGELHFPGEFRDQVMANWALTTDALLAGAGDALRIVDPGLVEEDDWDDPQNATEHFTYAGRVKIADALAAALPGPYGARA